MRRLFPMAIMLTGLLVLSPTDALAQPKNQHIPTIPRDPRMRRHQRELAVQRAGPMSRHFVEVWGDEAAAALLRCNSAVGQGLVLTDEARDFRRLPDARRLLLMIAHPEAGDDVARWVMENFEMLCNREHFEVFMKAPLEYSLRLRQLDDDVNAFREGRKGFGGFGDFVPAVPANFPWMVVWCFGGAAILTLWGRWRKKRKASPTVRPTTSPGIEHWRETDWGDDVGASDNLPNGGFSQGYPRN